MIDFVVNTILEGRLKHINMSTRDTRCIYYGPLWLNSAFFNLFPVFFLNFVWSQNSLFFFRIEYPTSVCFDWPWNFRLSAETLIWNYSFMYSWNVFFARPISAQKSGALGPINEIGSRATLKMFKMAVMPKLYCFLIVLWGRKRFSFVSNMSRENFRKPFFHNFYAPY